MKPTGRTRKEWDAHVARALRRARVDRLEMDNRTAFADLIWREAGITDPESREARGTSYSRWEDGESEPPLFAVVGAAKAAGISVEELLGLVAPVPAAPDLTAEDWAALKELARERRQK